MKITEGFMTDLVGKVTSFWKVAFMTTPALRQKNQDFMKLYDEMVKEYENIYADLLKNEDVVVNYGKDLPSPKEMALSLMQVNIKAIETKLKYGSKR